MAAELKVKIIAEMTGLGDEIFFAGVFSDTTPPTKSLFQYMEQATANVDEAIPVGDVATGGVLIVKAVTNDVMLDLDFVAAFDADLTLLEGRWAVIPQPAGTVHFEAVAADEKATIQYLLIGT